MCEKGQIVRNVTRRSAAALLGAIVAWASSVAGAVVAQAAPSSAAVAWGENASGELGDSTSANRSTAVQITGLSSGVASVAAGSVHSLAITSSGGVLSWGSNYTGELGDGTYTDRFTPVPVTGLAAGSGVAAVSAGEGHSLALKTDGTVLAWGANNWGQLGDGSLAARLTPVQVSGLGPGSGVIAIAAGNTHSLALKSDGTVLAWGSNTHVEVGSGSATLANPTPAPVVGLGTGSGVIAIAAGAEFNVVLKSSGAVFAWGHGSVGDGTGADRGTPVAVSGLGSGSGVIAVAAGTHGLALKSDGTVLSWGSNAQGQLGDGTTTDRQSPVQVTGLGTGSGVTSIAASGWQSAAVRAVGSVATWGFNFYGELGDGITGGGQCACSTAPVNVVGVTGATQIVVGGAHYIALQPTPGTIPGSAPPPVTGPAPPPTATFVQPSSLGAPTNVLVSPTDPLPFAIPHMAADPTRPGHLAIAYTAATGNPCSLATSVDGGATWTSISLVPGVLAFPASATNPGVQFDTCQTPSVTFGPDGTLFYAFMANMAFTAGNVFLTASTDGGQTFRIPQQLDVNARPPTDPVSGGDFAYAPLITADQTTGGGRGNVYVAFGQYQPSNNFTFGQERVVTCGAAQLQGYVAGGSLRCGGPIQVSMFGKRHLLTDYPVVGPDGRLYVSWTDDDETGPSGDYGGPVNFEVVSSGDHGVTFTTPTVADRIASICPGFICPGPAGGAPSTVFSYASLAAGPATGDLYLAVSGPRGVASRVSVSVSHDSGLTWGSRQIVGAIAGQASEQHSPNLAVAPDGRVDLAYYDVTEGGMQDTYITSSLDGGTTFSPPRKISNVSSDENILGPNSADISIGSVATDAGFAVAWADTRRGTIDSGKADIGFATTIPSPPAPPAPTPTSGYWLVAADGGIFPFGDVIGYGSTGAVRLNKPVVGMAATPTAHGYWLVAADGGIFPFGDAIGYGSTGAIRLNRPMVDMAPTPTGHGYWLVASDGGVFPFGDAVGYGSTGAIPLNRPIVGMAATPDGGGYWLVAADGGIFPFGDAVGYGSTGAIRLNKPIVGMAATASGHGYWLVASDGGIFPFGDAPGLGSTGGTVLNQPVVGMAASGEGAGYWLVAADGGIFPFGDAAGLGSTGRVRLNKPMVGMAAA